MEEIKLINVLKHLKGRGDLYEMNVEELQEYVSIFDKFDKLPEHILLYKEKVLDFLRIKIALDEIEQKNWINIQKKLEQNKLDIYSE